MLPLQGNSSLHNIQQQTEHLLHEYELDDETLQKAQVEQHKIFQNFPTSPSPAAPNTPPPPLPAGTNPKVSPLLEPNDQTLFWGAPKSLQMVTAAMKLKDAYSLEGKL